jgi:hypothetical protein
MRNIFISHTDKPSRLISDGEELMILRETCQDTHGFDINRQVHITSEEEIKDGDWVLTQNPQKPLEKITKDSYLPHYNKKLKIVLTTDLDLINDGVQEIPEEFLYWFVDNSTCEFVAIEIEDMFDETYGEMKGNWYNIIIPQEKLKQETLEEAAENYGWGIKKNTFSDPVKANDLANSAMEDFIVDAKWQAERMCSEEESFENKSLKWWMSLSTEEQVEIGFKYDEPTFNLTLRAIMFEFEQFKKNKS